MTKKSVPIWILGSYYLVLFAVWAVVEWLFHSSLISSSNPEQYWLVQNGVKEGLIKVVIWLLPALFLIGRYRQNAYISLKDMFTQPVNWLKLLPVFGLFTVYLAAGAALTHGSFGLSPDFVWPQLLLLPFVGITEEVVFRGWLLNMTIKSASLRKQWVMVALNSLLFLLIHFPLWIYTGQLSSVFTSFGFPAVYGLSVIFGWIFIRTKSIVPSIVLHVYWDGLMVLLYGG